MDEKEYRENLKKSKARIKKSMQKVKDKKILAANKKESAYYHSESFWSFFNKCSNFGFGVIIGPRKCGKTYVVADHFLKDWNKCKDNVLYYFRLTDAQKDKLLANNGEKLFDPPLVRKYFTNRGFMLKRRNDSIYAVKYKKGKKTGEEYKVVECGSLSTFYADKGTATYDFEFLKRDKKHKFWIIVDEFQKEEGEKSQGDLAYQFVNALHNKVRTTNKRMRCLLLCNNLRESSEILSGCFNFMPIDYGMFKLQKKKCIIHYYNPPESYWSMMNKGFTNRLVNDDDTTFINEFKFDMALITRERLYRPSAIIKFSKSPEDCFILWDNKVLKRFSKKSKDSKLPKVKTIAMYRGLDEVFDKKQQSLILDMLDQRGFKFASLMDKTQFESMCRLIRSNK